MLVPSAAVVKQFVQSSLHKLLARVRAALYIENLGVRKTDSTFEFYI